jgi:hypothetical protein
MYVRTVSKPAHVYTPVTDFLSGVKNGGVGAMELVAMHMKAQGQYVSRNLSFKGATFEICEEPLSEVRSSPHPLIRALLCNEVSWNAGEAMDTNSFFGIVHRNMY